MKPSFFTVRSAHGDGLAITDATRHPCGRTVQAETCDEDVLVEAMNRRHARAMLEKYPPRRRGVWALGACGAVALALWLI